MKQRFPKMTITDEGAVLIWPHDLHALVFGPGLDLEEVAYLEPKLDEAAGVLHRRLDAEEAEAKTVDLATYRQRRAERPRRHRRSS